MEKRRHIDEGTLCRHHSPPPGTAGTKAGPGANPWLGIGAWVSRTADIAVGHGTSTLLSVVDSLPFKAQSPISTALLKHYVERSGRLYTIDPIPEAWQDWIVRTVGRRVGRHCDLNPYNSGLYDLRNSLGHFDVDVSTTTGDRRLYAIFDNYHFGWTKNDKRKRGRHGFPLSALSEWQIETAKMLLPDDEHLNPGGFTERWEIKKTGKETVLYIPQQVLANQGEPFEVRGRFVR
jgi:hypothetical protein